MSDGDVEHESIGPACCQFDKFENNYETLQTSLFYLLLPRVSSSTLRSNFQVAHSMSLTTCGETFIPHSVRHRRRFIMLEINKQSKLFNRKKKISDFKENLRIEWIYIASSVFLMMKCLLIISLRFYLVKKRLKKMN